MKNHKLIKLGILTSSALVLGLGQPVLQTILPGFDGGVVKAEENDARRPLKVSGYGYDGDKRIELIPETTEYVTPDTSYTVAHPKVDGWKPTVTVLGTYDGTISRVESGSKLTYDDLHYEGGAGGGGINYVYERVSDSSVGDNTTSETLEKPQGDTPPDRNRTATDKVESDQVSRPITIQYVGTSEDGNTEGIKNNNDIDEAAFITPSVPYKVVHPTIPGYTPSGATLFANGVESDLEDGDQITYDYIASKGATYLGNLIYRYTAIPNWAPTNPVTPTPQEKTQVPSQEESTKKPEPFDYIGYGVWDGGKEVRLFKERRYIQPGEVLTITPTPKEGYTLKDARPIIVRYTEAKQMRNQYSQFNPDYTAASYAVTYLKNGATIPKQPELKYEYYDEAKAKELLESYEYKRKLVERALEIDPDDYTRESYWKTYTGTSEDITFSNGNFRTEIILLDTRHSLEQPLSEMKALAPAHYDYLINYNKATASIIKQSLDGLVPIKKKEEEKPTTPVKPPKPVEKPVENEQPFKYRIYYVDADTGKELLPTKEKFLAPGQSTVELPEKIVGYYDATYGKKVELNKDLLSGKELSVYISEDKDGVPRIGFGYRKEETPDPTKEPIKYRVHYRLGGLNSSYEDLIPPKEAVLKHAESISEKPVDIPGYKFENKWFSQIDLNYYMLAGKQYVQYIGMDPDGVQTISFFYQVDTDFKPTPKPEEKPSTPVKPIDKPTETPSEPKTPVVPIQPTAPVTPTSPTSQNNRVLSNVDGSVRVHGSETTLKDVSYIKVEEVVANPLSSKDYKAFDIRLYDANGKAIQPQGMVVVSVQADKAVENVYYVAPDGDLQKLDFTQEGNRVSFKTNHFSVYALAFRKLEAHRNSENGGGAVHQGQLTMSTVPVSNKTDKDNEETKVTSLPADKKSNAKSLPNTGETQSNLGILGFILALFGLAGWIYQGRHERGR